MWKEETEVEVAPLVAEVLVETAEVVEESGVEVTEEPDVLELLMPI